MHAIKEFQIFSLHIGADDICLDYRTRHHLQSCLISSLLCLNIFVLALCLRSWVQKSPVTPERGEGVKSHVLSCTGSV